MLIWPEEEKIRIISVSTASSIPSLLEMVASRPKGGYMFLKRFASHPVIAAIKTDASVPPEKIAAAFWKIRVQGMKAYPGPKWQHRFTLALRDHLIQERGVKQEIVNAIRGYHTLKMRARRESQLRSNTESDVGQKRQAYLKEYRARKSKERKETQLANREKSESQPDSISSSTLSSKDLEPVLDLVFSEFDTRPSSLELEVKFRDVMDLYDTRKQATTSLRYFLQRNLYTSDETDLACGSRARFLDELDLMNYYRQQKERKEDSHFANENIQRGSEDQNSMQLNTEFQSSLVAQEAKEGVDRLEMSDWWEDEYGL